MRNRKPITFLLILFFAILPLPGAYAAAAGQAPSASADMAVFSKYVWRGYELSDDSIVIQPSATISYRDFSFNIWGNLDTDYDSGTDSSSQFNETDMTLSYESNIDNVTLGAGYIYYGLDGTKDSQEVYLSMSLNTLLSPSLTVYREIAYTPAWYIRMGISHTFDLGDGASLDLAGSAGYYISNDDNFTEAKNPSEKYRAFHDGLVSATLKIPIDEYFVLSPMIGYSFPLSDKADDLIKATSFDRDSTFIFGGLTLSVAF